MQSIDPRLADEKPGNGEYEQQQHSAQQHDDAQVFHQAQHAPILPGDQRAQSLSSQIPELHQQQQQQQQHAHQLYHDPYEAPQQSYAPLPQTPQMGSNNGLNHQTSSNQNGSTQKRSPASGATPQDSDSKRPRACEACRGLKVKCEFEPTDPEGPCKRCKKAHRTCTITAPSRKRQKKTDSRVAELEKKIDALTQTLQATRSESQGGEIDVNVQGTERGEPHAQAHLYEQMASIAYGPQHTGRAEASNELPLAPSTYGQAMKTNMKNQGPNAWPAQDFQQYSRMPELSRPQGAFPGAPMEGQGNVDQAPMVMAGQKRKHSKTEVGGQAQKPGVLTPPPNNSAAQPSSKQSMTNEYADVIDRGLIKSNLASALFDRYTHHMAPTMPAVIFPSGTTAADIRKTKPILFLAILAVGAMTDHPDLAKLFTKEVMQVYADRIICRGEKSLELIQALLVSTLWYWPPEHFEEVKFYQLIHTAAVMSIEIGIHRQSKPPKPGNVASAATTGKSMAGMWNWRKQAFPDASSIESRRTWLSCYFICCNASTGLRRPNLIQCTPYIAESIEMLETSPLAVPSDKLIAQWAKSQRIMERIMPHFGLGEDHSNVTLADPNIQAALKGYEQDLDHWRDQVPQDCRGPLLKISGHIVSLFMHEIALNVDTPQEQNSDQPHGDQHLEVPPLPEAQVTALASCLESIDEIFSTFLSIDVDTIRVLPVMHFVRVAYAIAILIKVYFAATTPGNPFASIVDKDNMKVEQYLDDLLEKFKEIAKDEKSRPGSKFLMVLFMLRNCFYRGQKPKSALPSAQASTQQTRPGNTQAGEVAASQQQSPQQPQQQPQHGFGGTPLDLLSQVATGSSAATPRQDGKMVNQQPYNPMQQQPPWAPWDTPNTPHIPNMQQPPNGQSFNIDPSLGGAQPQMGYDNAGMEGGFDSIGMMGEGDLSQYFSDDAYQAFFKAMMEGAGTGGMGFDEYPMSIM